METLQRLHNRGSISTGYDIDNSCKFEEDNLEALYAQPTADGNQRTWTVSMWFKRTELGVSGVYNTLITALVGAETGSLYITPTDEIIADVGLGGTRNRQQTAMKFRDTSAWYHIVWRVDTTQGTAADRHRLYVNGVLQEWTTIDGYPAQNFQSNWNNNYPIYIGNYSTYNNYGFNGYIAEVHHTDGVSNAPTEFGEFDDDSGIWKPKAYTGSYGAQGFYLPFDDSSNLGTNAKGNDVNFTLQNITSADQATDTPTNNFATLNPLDNNWANVPTINEGATTHMLTSPSVWRGSSGTIAVSKGKWYWEIKTINSGGNLYMLGIGSTEYGEVPGSQSPHDVLNFAGLYLANSATEGGLFVTDSTGGSVYRNAFNPGANHSANDIYGFALDLDASTQTITFYRNGTNINPSSGAALDIAGACSILPVTIRLSIFEREAQCNFGGYTEFSIASGNADANGYGTFEYAPPSGYYALCTKNLEEYG